MKKRILCVILAMLMLVGCGKDDPDPTDDPKQSTAGNEQDETQKPTEDPADGTTVAPEETNPPLTQVYWVWAEGGLNVRSGPGKTYEAVGFLKDGEEIVPKKWENGWAYIEGTYKGWVSGDYIHKLGWFRDVKTPEGTPPKDNGMVGQWLHLTVPEVTGDVSRTKAGVFRFSKDGTFTHTVADYKKTADGWILLTPGDKQVFWVGEYSYDGVTLKLTYMARQNGREWVESKYELVMEPTADEGGSLFIKNGENIPVTATMGFNANTVDALYPLAGTAVKTLDKWYK